MTKRSRYNLLEDFENDIIRTSLLITSDLRWVS
jgi:hypothetical protein